MSAKEYLRTDPSRFENLPGFNFRENYLLMDGLRMHYLDEGGGETILALHGEPTWSFLYRKFVPELKDYRFVAPDLFGFGKSDKLVHWREYSFDFHFRSLEKLINSLSLDKITLIVQDWGGLLGLSLLGEYPERFSKVIIMNTFLPKGKSLPLAFRAWQLFARYHPSLPVSWIVKFGTTRHLTAEIRKAYDAPFPDSRYKAGARAFPQLVPSKPDDPGIERMNKARRVLGEWTKPALILFSDKDPVFSGLDKFFIRLIPSCQNQEATIIRSAGHFLQEDAGELIAQKIRQFMEKET